MKRILIIYPHWPPSNLVGVHRVRLIANELHQLGWNATVLTIDDRDYEEPPAYDTLRLVDPHVQVVKVRARPVRHWFGRRGIGDIGVRGFSALKKRADKLLAEEKAKGSPFDFIWFSVPSWYPALMGNSLSKKHAISFGIDYQDPWVRTLAKYQVGWNRATFTSLIARVLEPLALRNVALISGISEGYVEGVKQRYRRLENIPFVYAQLGFSHRDHHIDLKDFSVPFTTYKRAFVYAGAYWSMGAPLFKIWLEAVASLNSKKLIPEDVEFLFIGTGNPALPSIQKQAEDLGIGDIVREIPNRLSYLQVQQILRHSHGALIIGSTQAHYSASKVFQCLLTAPRVFGFFHEGSEAALILKEANATSFFAPYSSNKTPLETKAFVEQRILQFLDPNDPWDPNLEAIEAYSAKSSAQALINGIDCLKSKN
ncbi:MAG: hypothetical protein P8J33_07325 [Pirellulaceae bacterium]|nr:hypothetical protein [Pirellulaceae bacterium]